MISSQMNADTGVDAVFGGLPSGTQNATGGTRNGQSLAHDQAVTTVRSKQDHSMRNWMLIGLLALVILAVASQSTLMRRRLCTSSTGEEDPPSPEGIQDPPSEYLSLGNDKFWVQVKEKILIPSDRRHRYKKIVIYLQAEALGVDTLRQLRAVNGVEVQDNSTNVVVRNITRFTRDTVLKILDADGAVSRSDYEEFGIRSTCPVTFANECLDKIEAYIKFHNIGDLQVDQNYKRISHAHDFEGEGDSKLYVEYGLVGEKTGFEKHLNCVIKKVAKKITTAEQLRKGDRVLIIGGGRDGQTALVDTVNIIRDQYDDWRHRIIFENDNESKVFSRRSMMLIKAEDEEQLSLSSTSPPTESSNWYSIEPPELAEDSKMGCEEGSVTGRGSVGSISVTVDPGAI